MHRQTLPLRTLVSVVFGALIVNAQLAAPGSEISAQSLQPGGVTPGNSSSDTASEDKNFASVQQAGQSIPSDDSCLTDSTKPACRLFVYSEARAVQDLKAVCDSAPYLSGCSLFRLCTQGVDPVSIGKMPQTCDKFKLLATVCQFDKIAAEAEGCKSFQQLCLKEHSTVAQCNYTRGLKYVVPTAAAKQLSRSMCEHDSSADGCRRCNWSADNPKCDVLSVYGSLCCLHPGAAECGVWTKMCDKDSSLYVCRAQLPGGRPGPPGPPVHKISSSSLTEGDTPAAAPSPQQWAPSAAAGARLDWLSMAVVLLTAFVLEAWR